MGIFKKREWITTIIHEGKIKKIEPIRHSRQLEFDSGGSFTQAWKTWTIMFSDGAKTPLPIMLWHDENLVIVPGKTYQLIEMYKPATMWSEEERRVILQEKNED